MKSIKVLESLDLYKKLYKFHWFVDALELWTMQQDDAEIVL